MAKIYCHINQCDASVQYFAILHAVRFVTEKICRTTYASCRAAESLCIAAKDFSH